MNLWNIVITTEAKLSCVMVLSVVNSRLEKYLLVPLTTDGQSQKVRYKYLYL